MYVCLTLDKTAVDPSESCFIIPAPSLLAEPSRPSARYGHSEKQPSKMKTLSVRQYREVVPGRFSGDLLSPPGIVESGVI